jgi:hypothetical protein
MGEGAKRVPAVAPEGYHSEIVVRYERCSKTQERLLARLHLEGLASRDFEPSSGRPGGRRP